MSHGHLRRRLQNAINDLGLLILELPVINLTWAVIFPYELSAAFSETWPVRRVVPQRGPADMT